MPDIFLSYNREDQAVARRFAEAFRAEGFDVWWDVALRTGEAYDKVTETALRTAKAVVVLWSRKSVESRWVRAEATLADRNHTLVPCMIEPCERPIMFELTHTADLAHWDGDVGDKAWLAYLSDVKRFVAKGAPAPIDSSPTDKTKRAASRLWRRVRRRKLAIAAVFLVGAAVIAGSIKALSPSPAASANAPTDVAKRNPEAEAAYKQGLLLMDKRNSADLTNAIGYFKKALGIDDRYAEAHAALGRTYMLLLANGQSADTRELAFRETEKALQIEPANVPRK